MWDEIRGVFSKKDPVEYLKFGLTMGLFLFIVGTAFALSGVYIGYYIGGVGILLLGLGVLIPLSLMPIYIIWMSFAVIMGYIMTRIILTIIYYLIFSPVALVLRVIKKDLLDQKIYRDAPSYWKIRSENTYDPKSSENQY